jgi:endonuclease/exonuclease/phosphatase family metal-dependent hydrolase
MGRCAVLLVLLLSIAACRTGRNYPQTEGPRYAGAPDTVPAASHQREDTLHVVSFNIAFARHVDSAMVVLSSDAALRGADIVLLQEMNEDGTRRIAASLGMWYVYYPAIYHTRAQRDFGNAVLSRWPIVDDAKLLLPHVSRYAGTQRTATAATIRVGETAIRVYSTHLGTLADIGAEPRRAQLRAILADAAPYSRVIIGGDMNNGAVGDVARQGGFAWPTEAGPSTTRLGRWDHIFLKGMRTPDSAAAGTVLDVRHASDHRPVWAKAIVP